MICDELLGELLLRRAVTQCVVHDGKNLISISNMFDYWQLSTMRRKRSDLLPSACTWR